MSQSLTGQPEIVYRAKWGEGALEVLGLTGHYVLFDDESKVVVFDTRTGAATDIADDESPLVTATAASGVLAVNAVDAKGFSQLALAKVDDLPELHC